MHGSDDCNNATLDHGVRALGNGQNKGLIVADRRLNRSILPVLQMKAGVKIREERRFSHSPAGLGGIQ
jgi:hypothetical protein